MATEVEVYLLIVGIILGLAGGMAVIAGSFFGAKGDFLVVLRYGTLAGVLLVIGAFVYAALNGRSKALLDVITSSPVSLFDMIVNNASISSACTEDGRHCANYCCESLADPDKKWKDCSHLCNSHPRYVAARNTGDNCLYDMSLEAHCRWGAVQGATGGPSSSAPAGGCNADPSLGPITCFCCDGAGVKYFDCRPDCASNARVVANTVPIQACLDNQITTSFCVR